MERVQFSFDTVLQRLLQEVYGLLAALPLLVVALLVLWIAWMVGSWLSRRTVLDRLSNRNPFLRDLTRTTVRWIVTLLGLLIALELLNATALVGALLGTAGVLGIALGFAFKETLENYLAGILMSLRQPFAPRDHVVIGGNEGIVIALTSRATILMTPDGNHLRVPNALVFRSVMLNYTRNPNRRFEFDVGIGVNEDLVRAQQIGIRVLLALDGVLDHPPPRAFIAALGDSNVQVRYYGWVDQRTHDFLMLKSEAIRQVKSALEQAGLDLPEPIYRVQITERATVVEAMAASPKEKLKEPLSAETVDTGVNTELQAQLEHDERALDAQNLLDPKAPKE
ncbi:MAG TPA: mechanosensitive ion channel family protein [Thiobacillus sp.]